MKAFERRFVTRDPRRGARTIVVNAKKRRFDVYIGPPVIGATTRWFLGSNVYANPFMTGIDGTAQETLTKYAELLIARLCRSNPKWRFFIRQLRGLRLGCWCKPKPCHGDILARLADNLPPESEFPPRRPGTSELLRPYLTELETKLREAVELERKDKTPNSRKRVRRGNAQGQ